MNAMNTTDALSRDPEAQKALAVLSRHLGREQAISMVDLYRAVTGEDYVHSINHTRRVRKIVARLQESGVPVCSHPDPIMGGYFLAFDGPDLAAYVQGLEKAALRKLAKAARLKRVALPELLGQLALEAGDRGQGSGVREQEGPKGD